ncbi:MAG: glycoside hydrolase family 3 N-terminal domain-containing protein [Candidatus Neomarinimicrobiota bacterium]
MKAFNSTGIVRGVYATIITMVFLLVGCQGQQGDSTDRKVKGLLAEMTLEEKIGQMTQVSIEVVSKTQGMATQAWELDPAKLDTAILHYHIGSILNVWNKALAVEEWHYLITAIQDRATKKTRLGIPVIYGIDAIHGANYTMGATLFPQSINMAATWNPDLVRREGEIAALEMRASGIPWNFNPVLGVGRNPLWPRQWETYGEDPHVAAVMGAAYIAGQQGDNPSAADKVAACAKHYLGYSVPLTGKDRTPAWIPERMLREIFLPPFKAAVDAGVLTFMGNSSEINGIPVHASPFYLTEILRDELGFEGFLVSDWADINNLYTREKVAATPKEAVQIAVLAGVDMSMVPYDYSFYEYLLELVKEGDVPESRIDEAVSRILRVKYQLGLFDSPYPNSELAERFASNEAAAVSLQAARESITLLKNEGNLLPLKKDTRVFITGPAADSRSVLNSGWTITWQGNEESLYPQNKPTILGAVSEKVGQRNVTYLPGATFEEVGDVAAAVSAAKRADVAIICIGEAPYCESPGNIHDLTLSEPQLELAEALEGAGVAVVLVLVEGRPRIIHRIVDAARSVVWAGLPGMEGGQAAADVLFGDYNPAGRLPITYPRYANDLITYDHRNSEISWPNSYDPQFPFGHGLSYTTFEYSDLALDKSALDSGEKLNVSVTVMNTGKVAGYEAVLLYVSDLVRSVTPPVKQLKGFTKVFLEPGQGETVAFTLSEKDLAFVGLDNRWITEPGEFVVRVGSLEGTFVLK